MCANEVNLTRSLSRAVFLFLAGLKVHSVFEV